MQLCICVVVYDLFSDSRGELILQAKPVVNSTEDEIS